MADAAARADVRHLVYRSANAPRDSPTGIGHFGSKSTVERHVAPLVPGLLTMDDWLARPGEPLLRKALVAAGTGFALR